MEEKKLTDEEWFKEYTKNAHSLEEAYCEQLGWGGTTDEAVEREIEFDKRLIAYVHRLKKENEELKSPKFASWKLKFFNLKEEFDKELSEHEEFTKKAKAEIEGLTEKQNDYRANTELFRNSCKFWEEKFQGAMQVNAELQKQVDELKAENTELYKEHTTLIAGSILQKKQAVRDTAKEILNDLRNIFIEQSSYGCDANQHIGYYDYVVKIGLVIEQVEEYAKLKYGIEYGVEVE